MISSSPRKNQDVEKSPCGKIGHSPGHILADLIELDQHRSGRIKQIDDLYDRLRRRRRSRCGPGRHTKHRRQNKHHALHDERFQISSTFATAHATLAEFSDTLKRTRLPVSSL
jgi:hypothetical protein